MRRIIFVAAILAISMPSAAIAMDQHATVQADGLKWTTAPPALPPGAQIAIMNGDPGKEGLYVIRLKAPAGYKIPAHTHAHDENVTVLSGTFHIGMGDKLDETKGQALKPGGYGHVPKGMQHFAWFTEDTIIQVHGIGPQSFTYVNPADDPRKK